MRTVIGVLVLCSAGLSAWGQLRLCGLDDYATAFGPCGSDKLRKGEMKVKPGAQCTLGGGRSSIPLAVECSCYPTDYTTNFIGPCSADGMQDYKISPTAHKACTSHEILDDICPAAKDSAFDPTGTTCGLTLCQCSEDDIGSTFTPCNPRTRLRRLVYFWKTKCEPGSLELPHPSDPRECDIRCPSGQYLNSTAFECRACKAGTTSSSAVRYGPPWHDLPPAFYARCMNIADCEEWKPEGGYLSSSPARDTSTVHLWVSVKTLPAYLKLTYRVVGNIKGLGEAVVRVDGFYIASARGNEEGDESWRTITVDLVNRDFCLWELKLATGATTRTVCLASNHILPYLPEMQVPESFASESAARPFYVSAVDGHQDACADLRVPYDVALDRKWVALLNESAFTPNCTWGEALARACDRGAAAIIVLTTSDLVSPMYSPYLKRMRCPVAYVREDVPELFATQVETAVFELKTYTQFVSDVTIEYLKYAFIENSSALHIKEVEVYGLKAAASECTECPAGTYSGAGSPYGCLKCPYGTHSAHPGSTGCAPCETGVSTPDGTGCAAKECSHTAADYVADLGRCRYQNVPDCPDHVEACSCTFTHKFITTLGCHSLRRNLTYLSPICDPYLNLSHTPVSEELLCAPCPVGQFFDDQLECRRCPVGSASIVDGSLMTDVDGGCKACDLGVLPSLRYGSEPGDRQWAPNLFGGLCDVDESCEWSKHCDDWPDSQCFVPRFPASHLPGSGAGDPVSVQNGAGLQDAVDVTQRLDFESEFVHNYGSVTFSYRWDSGGKSSSGVTVSFSAYSYDLDEVVFEKRNLLVAPPPGAQDGVMAVSTLPATLSGRVRLRWEYRKEKPTEADVLFFLAGVDMRGATAGGSNTCLTECPLGLSCSPGSYPVPCPPGKKGVKGGVFCEQCPAGTVSFAPASVECVVCPPYLAANQDQSRCIPKPLADGGSSCKFKLDDGSEWDLSQTGNASHFEVEPYVDNRLGAGGSDADVAVSRVKTSVVLCPHAARTQDYVVRRDPEKLKDDVLGRKVAVIKLPNDEPGLRFLFTEGDPCVTRSGETKRASVDITVRCGVGSTASARAFMRELAPMEDCYSAFEYATPQPCTTCTADSWQLIESTECIDGFSGAKYFPVQGVRCVGSPPEVPRDTLVECSDNVMVPHPPAKTQSSSNLVTITVVLTLILLSLLGGVGYLFHQRSRALKAKYSALTSGESRRELQRQMGELGVDDSGVESPRSGGDVDDDPACS